MPFGGCPIFMSKADKERDINSFQSVFELSLRQ